MNRYDVTKLGMLKRGDVFYFKNKFKAKKPKFVLEMKQPSLFDPNTIDHVVVITKDESRRKQEMKKFKPDLEVIYLRSLT